MWKKFKSWFFGATPEEAYENGRKTVDTYLRDGMAQGRNPALVAEHLWAMGFGGFNTTKAHREFDRGVQDKLEELGYPCPY